MRVCNTSYSVFTNPTLSVMGFLTHFNLQTSSVTGSMLVGTRVKPAQSTQMSRSQLQTFHGMELLLSGQCPSPNTDVGTWASLPVYIYPWPRCYFPTMNTSSPVPMALKQRQEFFPLYTHLFRHASC